MSNPRWPRLPDPEAVATCAEAIRILILDRVQKAERAHMEADLELEAFLARVPVLKAHGMEDPTWSGNGWEAQEKSLRSACTQAAARAELWRMTLSFAQEKMPVGEQPDEEEDDE